jgi:hypothetical protein
MMTRRQLDADRRSTELKNEVGLGKASDYVLCCNTVGYENKRLLLALMLPSRKKLGVEDCCKHGLYSMKAIMMIVMSGEPRCPTSDVQHWKFSLLDLDIFSFVHFGRSSVIVYESRGTCWLVDIDTDVRQTRASNRTLKSAC